MMVDENESKNKKEMSGNSVLSHVNITTLKPDDKLENNLFEVAIHSSCKLAPLMN